YVARVSSASAAVMSVSMKPGATAFTVTLRDASSRASARVKPSTPAFVAAYADWPALPVALTTDVTLTIRPERARTIARAAALLQWKTPLRFTATIRSQSLAL